MKKQKKLGTAGLADFFRQFSVLVSSGLPVAGALEIMETDETDQRFSRACRLFKQRMTDGMAIGDAMEETGAFPELAVQMIRSAEIGGHLGKTTMKLSEHYEKEHRAEGKNPQCYAVPEDPYLYDDIPAPVCLSSDPSDAGTTP